MIDQSTIGRIMDASDIVEVVSDFVSLKRRGVNYLGNCPFHNEKTPSFTVSPAKQIFKCFGCGKGGNSVNFIMDHEHLTYVEALKYLGKKFNIEVVDKEETPEEKEKKDKRESLMIVSAFAQKYFSNFLLNQNEGRTVGLSYFKERGFREDIIKKFDLGYCPDGKHQFTDDAQKQGYKMEFLTGTGLTIKKDDWVVDRFSGRVMFPFHNLAGRVIAFGGRTMKTDKKIAKYLNSPESEIYHKSRELYGIYQAKNSISRQEKCFLVEGYTDVLSLHQSGIENVVASSGTSLTEDQIRLIKRFTENVTVIYDGDQAGIKASLRGIDMILQEGINIKVVPLPEGEDPDSFAKSMSGTELAEYIKKNETDFIQFKTQLLLDDTTNDPIARARLISDIVKSISVIPDSITRSVYIKECSKLLDVKEEVLYDEVHKNIHKKTEDNFRKVQREKFRAQSKPVAKPVTPEPKNAKNTCEREEKAILRLLLRYFNTVFIELEDEDSNTTQRVTVGEFIINELENDQMESTDPTIKLVFSELNEHLNEEFFDPIRHFVQHENTAVNHLISDIVVDKYTESDIWRKNGTYVEEEEEILYVLVPRVVEEYKFRKVNQMMKGIEHQISQLQSNDDIDKIISLQQQYQNLKLITKTLSEKLGKRTYIP